MNQKTANGVFGNEEHKFEKDLISGFLRDILNDQLNHSVLIMVILSFLADGFARFQQLKFRSSKRNSY